jgi:hypothetical protein
VNIFLAGKMDVRNGGWRTALVGTSWHSDLRMQVPNWYSVGYWMAGFRNVHGTWQPKPKVIFGLHDYVGPFLASWGTVPVAEQHGGRLQAGILDTSACGHGSGCTCNGTEISAQALEIRDRCIDAIRQADMVFALINSPDAYGTVAEIAIARMMGKFVAVMIHPKAPFAAEDFWFAQSLANHVVEWPYEEHFGSSEDDPEEGYSLKYDDDIPAAIAGLRDAFVAYTGWMPPHRVGSVSNETIVGSERATVARSLQQIQQWTSDPRVRGEAARVLSQLLG